MINQLLINLAFFTSHTSGDSIPMFRKEVEKLARYMGSPPELYSSDTCFHYSGLLKIEVNRLSKIVSFVVSDGSPGWIKEDLVKLIERKYINLKKLDSLALREGLKNTIILCPLILEIADYPCKKEIKTGILQENYFHFEGKNLQGNIHFENPIYFLFSKGTPDHIINYEEIKPREKPLLILKN